MAGVFLDGIIQDGDILEIIERINVGGFNHLELVRFNLFTRDTYDLLLSAICRGSFTRLTLNVSGITVDQQLLLSQFIYNSSIYYVCFVSISDAQLPLIKDIILSPNLRVLELKLCNEIPIIFDTITTQLSKSSLVKLDITGYNIDSLNNLNKFSEIKNTKLQILKIGWICDLHGLSPMIERILQNNIRLVNICCYKSPTLEYNRKINHNASVSAERAHNYIVKLYKPGHTANITSHKHILSIIANKVAKTADDDAWIDLAVKKYSQINRTNSGYNLECKVFGLIVVGIVALSIFCLVDNK